MGYKVEFFALPSQKSPPGIIQLESTKAEILTQEILELSSKGAITPSNGSRDGYTSQTFLVPKSDGSWCPVVNLKSLNRWVVPHHFKIESIRTVKVLLIQGDWMVKYDLKDAYQSIPIHMSHQMFLRFRWESREWQFQALPFDLSSALYIFTKILKPVVAVMRQLGIRLTLYLDNMQIIDMQWNS